MKKLDYNRAVKQDFLLPKALKTRVSKAKNLNVTLTKGTNVKHYLN